MVANTMPCRSTSIQRRRALVFGGLGGAGPTRLLFAGSPLSQGIATKRKNK